ncbi:hypothetical protein HDU84_002977 [Entophlyctis sp. JEL0112]|nr:hypothetical protein HDU84_002977 [Entophlyctis sp. JEL0112]
MQHPNPFGSAPSNPFARAVPQPLTHSQSFDATTAAAVASYHELHLAHAGGKPDNSNSNPFASNPFLPFSHPHQRSASDPSVVFNAKSHEFDSFSSVSLFQAGNPFATSGRKPTTEARNPFLQTQTGNSALGAEPIPTVIRPVVGSGFIPHQPSPLRPAEAIASNPFQNPMFHTTTKEIPTPPQEKVERPETSGDNERSDAELARVLQEEEDSVLALHLEYQQAGGRRRKHRNHDSRHIGSMLVIEENDGAATGSTRVSASRVSSEFHAARERQPSPLPPLAPTAAPRRPTANFLSFLPNSMSRSRSAQPQSDFSAEGTGINSNATQSIRGSFLGPPAAGASALLAIRRIGTLQRRSSASPTAAQEIGGTAEPQSPTGTDAMSVAAPAAESAFPGASFPSRSRPFLRRGSNNLFSAVAGSGKLGSDPNIAAPKPVGDDSAVVGKPFLDGPFERSRAEAPSKFASTISRSATRRDEASSGIKPIRVLDICVWGKECVTVLEGSKCLFYVNLRNKVDESGKAVS